MNDNIIKTIINGGFASVALFSLYVLYKILSNDLPHIQEAIEKQAVSNERVAAAVIQIHDGQERQTEVLMGVRDSQQELKTFLQSVFRQPVFIQNNPTGITR